MTVSAPRANLAAIVVFAWTACGGELDIGPGPDAAPPDAAPPDRSAPCDEFFPCQAPGATTFSFCGVAFPARGYERLAGRPLYAWIHDADDPDGPPLADGAFDECGRFAAIDVAVPARARVRVAVDDPPDGDLDDFVATDQLFDVAPGALLGGRFLFLVSRADESDWSASAGVPLAAPGAALAFVSHDGVSPRAGVTLLIDGAVDADRDHYFGVTRDALDPLATATGPSGFAIATSVAASISGPSCISVDVATRPARFLFLYLTCP